MVFLGYGNNILHKKSLTVNETRKLLLKSARYEHSLQRLTGQHSSFNKLTKITVE